MIRKKSGEMSSRNRLFQKTTRCLGKVSSGMTLLILLSTPCFAITLEQRLQNPVQEKQAEEIFKQLRCMVCEGESLHDSKADLAKDMREHIRTDIRGGKTEKEIIGSLQQAYGDQILLKPPLRGSTLLLWLAPVLFLIFGIFLLFRNHHKRYNETLK